MVLEQAEVLRFLRVQHHDQPNAERQPLKPSPTNQPRTQNETTASHTARGPRISQALTEM